MARVTVQFVCTECGTTSGRSLGRCPGCGAFGTLIEELQGDAVALGVRAAAPVRLGEVAAVESARIATGVPEFDRVLGGGLVPASLVPSEVSLVSGSRLSSCPRSRP